METDHYLYSMKEKIRHTDKDSNHYVDEKLCDLIRKMLHQAYYYDDRDYYYLTSKDFYDYLTKKNNQKNKR